MMNWNDVLVTREHNKDLLREAEQDRLVQRAKASNNETSVWQKVKGLFGATNGTEKPADGTSCQSSFETAY